MTTKTTAAVGAIHDLTVATEFLMTALREITAGAAPEDPQVRQWVGMAVRKLGPIATA